MAGGRSMQVTRVRITEAHPLFDLIKEIKECRRAASSL
jgi:hypothetical protein